MTDSGLIARLSPGEPATLQGDQPPVEFGGSSAVAVGQIDATAVLKEYAERGPAALASVDGHGAVVVHDTDRGALVVAAHGAQPLYYTTEGGVRVASKPGDLDVSLSADPDGVRRFIETGDTTGCLSGARQVAPGGVVSVRQDGTVEVVSQPSATAPSSPSAAALEDVARFADHLTAHLWRFLHETGTPAATPADYLRWAQARTEDAPTLVPTKDIMIRLKNRTYGTFLSDTFGSRPWQDANAVIAGFEQFISSNGAAGYPDRFWRHYLAEQWARVVLEGEPAPVEVPEKGPFDPNQGKRIEITVDGQTWLRFPIRTELFAKGDDLDAKISGYVRGLVDAAAAEGRDIFSKPWYLVVSEKIVAIAQGRSYFIWEIKPGWWARTLSKFVVRTPYGIGLGSPWTMQLALQEAGLPRILLASAVSAVGKAIGKRGWFYKVAGPEVRAIDGPTEYSAYPANVSAKLAPAKPAKVSAQLALTLRQSLPSPAKDTLHGVVIIDANDIGRNVMGQASDRPDSFFEAVFADNPLGQGNERTPLCVVTLA